MKPWFDKYPYELADKQAFELIISRLHHADGLRAQGDKNYCVELDKVREMIEDYLEVKGLKPPPRAVIVAAQ